MPSSIKTALVGFGKAGAYLHAPFIAASPHFELSCIVERTPKNAAQQYPHATIVRTYEDVLKEPLIELVVLATPNETHALMAEQALLSGKHVVVDKPFTVRAEEAMHLQKLSEQTGKKIFVYQNRRWDGDFLTVRKLLNEHVLGDILSIESRFDRYRPEPRTTYWKESDVLGNGLWYDLGPHLMDQACQLYGEPITYNAEIKKQRSAAVGIDYFNVTFVYEKLTYGIHAGMLEKEPTPRWLIQGSKGTYIKYGVDPQEAKLNAGEAPTGQAWGMEEPTDYGTIFFTDGSSVSYPTLNGDYRMFYQSVYEAIRNNTPFPITLNSAVTLIGWLERLALNNGEL